MAADPSLWISAIIAATIARSDNSLSQTDCGEDPNHNRLSKGRSKDLPPEKLHFNHFWGARTFGWGDVIPDELLAKTDEYLVFKELAEAVRAWTEIRRRRLGSEAVQPPPASFLSS